MKDFKEYEEGKYIVKEYFNGNKYYYLNGLLNREDGPAVTYGNRAEYWYKEGEIHRIGGPAVKYYINGYRLYYIKGVQYSKEDYDKIIATTI